ncbi:MAG: SDR family oxidoreductase [Chloroflexi bacterium]|nr:SDR family oxidoreductase [Chloroflexota bacterium]
MRVLVTGGAGFLGSHLCARLLGLGHDVVALDNLLTGSTTNLDPIRAHPRFQFVRHDVTEPCDIPAEAVFHLASPASPEGYLRHPLETALANSNGTRQALALSHRYHASFLMASTSEIYGDPLVHPQPEDYWGNVNPIGPRSCYDEGKRFAEALTMIYYRQYGLDARIVRIFNCYGPHSDPHDGRIVPNFVTQALAGRPITVYHPGTQTRSLCYVSDLVDGLIRAMFTPGTAGGVFNLGNPEEHTVLEYAETVRRLAHSSSAIVFRDPVSADDPQRRRPDITRARQVLGWEPRVGLEEGLLETIEWFRQRLDVARV